MLPEGIRTIGDGLLEVTKERLDELLVQQDINEIYDVEEAPFARGKFATVRRAIHKNTGVHFAAKFLRRRRRALCTLKEIGHEIAILMLCDDSKHIVKLNAVHETRTDTALLLELAHGGELQAMLDDECALTEAQTCICMREILKALKYLHKKSIAHLDLKPQNILLSGDKLEDGLKLCDFGISRMIGDNERIREILGTPDYVAPEVLNYESLSLKTDIWSVGVLAYVLLSGCSPFGGDTKQETFLNISQCSLTFPDELFEDVSPLAIDFIRSALRIKANERMSASECLEHRWLNEECLPSLLMQPTSLTNINQIQTNIDNEITTTTTTIDFNDKFLNNKCSTNKINDIDLNNSIIISNDDDDDDSCKCKNNIIIINGHSNHNNSNDNECCDVIDDNINNDVNTQESQLYDDDDNNNNDQVTINTNVQSNHHSLPTTITTIKTIVTINDNNNHLTNNTNINSDQPTTTTTNGHYETINFDESICNKENISTSQQHQKGLIRNYNNQQQQQQQSPSSQQQPHQSSTIVITTNGHNNNNNNNNNYNHLYNNHHVFDNIIDCCDKTSKNIDINNKTEISTITINLSNSYDLNNKSHQHQQQHQRQDVNDDDDDDENDEQTMLFPDAPTTPKVCRKSTPDSPPSVKALVKKFQLKQQSSPQHNQHNESICNNIILPTLSSPSPSPSSSTSTSTSTPSTSTPSTSTPTMNQQHRRNSIENHNDIRIDNDNIVIETAAAATAQPQQHHQQQQQHQQHQQHQLQQQQQQQHSTIDEDEFCATRCSVNCIACGPTCRHLNGRKSSTIGIDQGIIC